MEKRSKNFLTFSSEPAGKLNILGLAAEYHVRMEINFHEGIGHLTWIVTLLAWIAAKLLRM